MSFTKAGQLTRQTSTARPDDTLGLVAENLRSSPHGVLPVLDRVLFEDENGVVHPPSSRVLGLVYERDVSKAMIDRLRGDAATLETAAAVVEPVAEPMAEPTVEAASATAFEAAGPTTAAPATSTLPDPFAAAPSLNGHAAPSPNGRVRSDLTTRDVMRQNIGIVPAAFSLHNALLTLERYDSPALPVVDAMGNYRGMISRSDVVAALEQSVRPPLVGGMATPLGVWLTTGHLNAGASVLGLFLSGVLLALCFIAARWLMLIGLTLISRDWGAVFVAPELGIELAVPAGFSALTAAGQYLLFLLLLRSLPLSGVHAAEHQTVWAIEKGVPLTPENVERMPRAHPRCGTNLAALAILFVSIFTSLPSINESSIILSLLFIFLVWRRFGVFFQEWFTTRPATRRQLENGIAAGRELMEKYQQQPHLEVSFGARLFNSGLLVLGGGMMLTMVLLQLLESLALSRLLSAF